MIDRKDTIYVRTMQKDANPFKGLYIHGIDSYDADTSEFSKSIDTMFVSVREKTWKQEWIELFKKNATMISVTIILTAIIYSIINII